MGGGVCGHAQVEDGDEYRVGGDQHGVDAVGIFEYGAGGVWG